MSVLRSSSRSRGYPNHSARSSYSKQSFATTTSSIMRHHRTDFAKFYVDLCRLQHSNPLQAVTRGLDKGVLEVIGDRIKFDDWYPIVTALEWDQSLHSVTIRLRPAVKVAVLDADTDMKARVSGKYPALTTKFVLYCLLEALRKMLASSPSLRRLELEGLPLNAELVHILAQGLLESRYLQHLSITKCSIEDEGAEILCLAVRNTTSLTTLDLSSSDLTHVAAEDIAKLLSLQKLSRYSETWKQTLRYRDPDVETMAGLRRLTLNNNAEMGDDGIQMIAEVLQDDLWLRALDIQNTGVTDSGAIYLSQLVRSNPNLVVVDARANPGMSQDSLSEMMRFLIINNADKCESEYKWLRVTTNSEPKSGNGSQRSRITDKTNLFQGWRSKNDCLMPRNVPPTMCSSVPSIPVYAKAASSRHSIEQEAIKRENDTLRRQVQELNGILHVEVMQKMDLVNENKRLKEMADRYQKEKKSLQESCQKSAVTAETLKAIEETFTRLAAMFSEEEDPELAQLVADMRSVLGEVPSVENKHVELTLNPIGTDLHERVCNMKNNNKDKVIWEEEETAAEEKDRREKRRRKNKDSKRKVRQKNEQLRMKQLEEQKKNDEKEFRRIFAKIITDKFKKSENVMNRQNLSSSSSDGDLSS